MRKTVFRFVKRLFSWQSLQFEDRLIKVERAVARIEKRQYRSGEAERLREPDPALDRKSGPGWDPDTLMAFPFLAAFPDFLGVGKESVEVPVNGYGDRGEHSETEGAGVEEPAES